MRRTAGNGPGGQIDAGGEIFFPGARQRSGGIDLQAVGPYARAVHETVIIAVSERKGHGGRLPAGQQRLTVGKAYLGRHPAALRAGGRGREEGRVVGHRNGGGGIGERPGRDDNIRYLG